MRFGLPIEFALARRLIVDFVFRPFPNRNLSLQFIHRPLTRPECLGAMPDRPPHKKRGFARSNKSNSMVDDNEFKREFLDRSLRNERQLMLGHCLVCFVFDSVDSPPVLGATNNPPKIDGCPGRKACPERKSCPERSRMGRRIDIPPWRFEPRFRQ